MNYNQNFRYPPPGFEQHHPRPNQNLPPNPQFPCPTPRFHPHYIPPPPDYRYDSRHARPPPYNRFTPPMPYDASVHANRFSVPPPFNPSRPPPRLPYRPNELGFRAAYRPPSVPIKNRFSTKPTYRRESRSDAPPLTERDQLLVKWRSNYCETSDDITRKLAEMDPNENKDLWIRSSPADVFYKRSDNGDVESTSRLDTLCTLFDQELVARGPKIREKQPPYNTPPRKRKHKVCRHKCKLKQVK